MPFVSTTVQGWQNLYTLSGVSVGAALLVQNQSANPIYTLEQAAQPGATARGRLLASGEEMEVDSGALGLWATGPLRVFVQDAS